MGQQQLLLLVLGIVIVGIAAVAGIQAFSEGKDNAERDALVADASRVVGDIQAWYYKPKPFGGAGEDATELGSFTKWSVISRSDSSGNGKYTTTNGCMTLTSESSVAKVTLFEDDTCQSTAEIATISIAGGDASDVTWAYK